MRKFATLAACAALFLVTAPWPIAHSQPQSRQPAAETHHTLWSVKGRTNTVYLLGSVHFLRPTEQLPAAVDAAYKDAEKLVMEIDMDDLDPLAAQQTTMELGMLPADRTLEAELGADAYAKVAKQAHELGLEPQILNRLRPWLAAMTLVQLQLVKQGLDPESGVEQQLTARAVADRKPITGFETLQEQLGMLANLSRDQQREFLLYSVEDAEQAARDIDELIAAWRQGDTKALGQLLSREFERYPALYRPLTVDRNRRWVPQIEALLNEKDDYLVVVGALHLVGKNSVIELLEKDNYKVTQQ
ncbi:MAG TPA: TraB/GumN family protein [Steroidobacteraceae bacterium]|jgi:hypothetical protein